MANVHLKPLGNFRWALSNSLCDEGTAIIVGEGHCFYYGFRVRNDNFFLTI